MSAFSSPLNVSRLEIKGDGVTELLSSVEKMKIPDSENPLKVLFDQEIKPANLKEKLLCATFEIIAEKGSEALSASELIKRTKSSKGALFHHFQTIDELCIESLEYFRQRAHLSLLQIKFQNLEEYLSKVAAHSMSRQSTRYYAHLVDFFRDRAIRDERYRIPLKALFEANIDLIVNGVMTYLNPQVPKALVAKKVLFFLLTIERCGFHRLLYQEPLAFEDEIQESLKFTVHQIQNIK